MATLTTADLPESKRFAAWRDAICDTFFPVDCRKGSDRPFLGELATTRTADIGFARVRSREQVISRTSYHINREEVGLFLFSLQLSGTCVFFQDGREVRLEPGDITGYDSDRPFSAIQSGDFEQLMIFFPRCKITEKIGRTEEFTIRALRRDTPMGALLSDFVRQVIVVAENADPFTVRRLSEVAISLAVAGLGGLLNKEGRQSSGRVALLYLAKTYIENHLHDPSLNPEQVADALGISLRYLQDLFQREEMTVSNWIWSRRLEKCRRDLLDPLVANRSISQIAFGCGFNSFSHFSRRFKAAFSISPSEFRRQQLATP